MNNLQNIKSINGVMENSPLDDLGIAHFVSNFEGDILLVNRAFLEMFDYASFDEIRGLNIKKDFYSNPGSRDALLNLLTQKKQVKNYRLLLLKKNGAKVYTQVTKKLIYINGSLEIETFVKDISDTILKEFELKKEIKELKESADKGESTFSNELKFRYLRGVGHGVRTPITSLLGYLTMLENNLYKNKNEYREIIFDSKNAVTKLSETVNSLIDLTRIETGSLQLYDEKFNLLEEITSVDASLNSFFGNSGYFRFEIEKGVPGVIRGDNLRFRQILLNVLKYLSESNGGVEIITLIKQVTRERKKLTLGVEILGDLETINVPDIEKLKRFPEAKENLYNLEEYELGFFIAVEYIKALGGTYEIISTGENKSFKFDVSFYVDNLAEAEILSESPEESQQVNVHSEICRENPESVDMSDKKILLVEDDKGNRGVEEKILRNAGYHVFSTGSGREAIEELKKNNYDIILMDIAMEDIDGISASKIIREMPEPKNSIPIIAVTAHCSMQDRGKCLDAGMNDYISKPINFKYLKLTIEQWIKKSENAVVSL